MAHDSTSFYPLGYSRTEQGRLEQQAAFLDELTDDVLCRAGLRSGMRVLDVGCGMGDVALLAARLVGPQGSVLGIDRNPDSLSRARHRAADARLNNVEFRQGELPSIPNGDGPFDAVVGRLIMIYFRDPVAALIELLKHVLPGGIIVFHEPDLSRAEAIPPFSSMTENVQRMVETFSRSGFHPRIGIQLDRIFRDAGLNPSLLGLTRMEGHGDGFSPAWLTMTIRSLLPTMVQMGIATEADIDVETLEDRIRAEARDSGSLILGPLMVGAWAVKPESLQAEGS